MPSQHGPIWLAADPNSDFPPLNHALDEPNGLLAAGGDLSSPRLLKAYAQGIFPWFSDDQPILWWSPDPRMVLYPDALHLSRSLKKTLRRVEQDSHYQYRYNHAFAQVLDACASVPRPGQDGTWITADMYSAYLQLHQQGHAHSAELWHNDQLIGGLYGVAIGRVFFGESMFSRQPDASKCVFARLVTQLREANFAIIDCQVYTDHLARFGAELIERSRFATTLEHACHQAPRHNPFQKRPGAPT